MEILKLEKQGRQSLTDALIAKGERSSGLYKGQSEEGFSVKIHTFSSGRVSGAIWGDRPRDGSDWRALASYSGPTINHVISRLEEAAPHTALGPVKLLLE